MRGRRDAAVYTANAKGKECREKERVSFCEVVVPAVFAIEDC